jgi:hypothetical protein
LELNFGGNSAADMGKIIILSGSGVWLLRARERYHV